MANTLGGAIQQKINTPKPAPQVQPQPSEPVKTNYVKNTQNIIKQIKRRQKQGTI